jgi:hypothetical protein
MKITIMQPAYLPWLGFFDRIDASDLCIILDNVQLDTNSKTRFTNRNKIRTRDGWIWLTLPIKTKGLYGEVLIKDIELVNDNWALKHWKSIENNYRKSTYFQNYAKFFEQIYSKEWLKMQDLIDITTDYFLKVLNINTPIIKASSLLTLNKKDDLILELCESQKAKTYYSGVFGREYLHLEKFRQKNIDVFFHEYQHPIYKQNYQGFEPYMSVLDLLFNCGDESMEIIRKGRNFVA